MTYQVYTKKPFYTVILLYLVKHQLLFLNYFKFKINSNFLTRRVDPLKAVPPKNFLFYRTSYLP